MLNTDLNEPIEGAQPTGNASDRNDSPLAFEAGHSSVSLSPSMQSSARAPVRMGGRVTATDEEDSAELNLAEDHP